MVVLQDRDNKPSLLLGGLSVLVYAACAVFVTGPERTSWWLGAYVVSWALYLVLLLRDRQRDFVASAGVLLAWAVLARLVLAFSDVWLNDDLWRYLLDGRVFLEGINPYRYAPSDPVVQQHFAALAARVHQPDLPTITPPAVHLVGALAALMQLMETGWRILVSLADVGTMVLVARLFGGGDRGWRAAAVYGLCPLGVFEAGANGHPEALAALPLVYAVTAMGRRRPWRAGLAFGVAILVKSYALLLLPLWIRQSGFRRMAVSALAVAAMGLLPFTMGGVDVFAGLRSWLAHWSFNSPLYTLLQALPLDETVLRIAPFALAVVAAGVTGWLREEPVSAIPMVLFGYLVIGPTLQPWFALWLLPWLGARPHPGLWAFVGAMGGSYAVWWSVVHRGVWELPPGVAETMWGVVAIGWLLSFWREPGQTPEPV